MVKIAVRVVFSDLVLSSFDRSPPKKSLWYCDIAVHERLTFYGMLGPARTKINMPRIVIVRP
jgi:hypothetical protein